MKKKPLYTIFLIVFIDLLGFGIILPLLPFIAEKFKASDFQVGLLTATYSFFQFVGAPILGDLSDRFGRKKILLISQIGTFAGFIMLGFANSLWLIFLSRLIDGLTGGNISIAQAYIADVTTSKNRARGMGIIGADFGLGFIFGPAIGGFLAQFGFATPAFFAAFISLLSVFATLFLLKETVTNNKAIPIQKKKFDLKKLYLLLKQKPIGFLIILFFVLNLAFSSFQGIFALWAERKLNFGPQNIGYLFAYIGILSVITQLKILPELLKRIKEIKLLQLGVLMRSIGLVLVPFSTFPFVIYISFFLIAIGNGISEPTLQSIASENVDQKHYGQVLGYLQSSGSLGRISGPILGGGLFEFIGTSAPFLFAGSTTFLAYLYSLQALNVSLLDKIKARFRSFFS
jgi:DHA1 family tetracycline resistance protein-like MFS transporter